MVVSGSADTTLMVWDTNPAFGRGRISVSGWRADFLAAKALQPQASISVPPCPHLNKKVICDPPSFPLLLLHCRTTCLASSPARTPAAAAAAAPTLLAVWSPGQHHLRGSQVGGGASCGVQQQRGSVRRTAAGGARCARLPPCRAFTCCHPPVLCSPELDLVLSGAADGALLLHSLSTGR